MKQPEELSIASINRLLRKDGAKRISADACVLVAVALENYSRRIVRKAKEYSAHAGRKTIKAEDIMLAIKDIGI